MKPEEATVTNSITDKHAELDKLVNDFYNSLTEDFLELESEYRESTKNLIESINELWDTQTELYDRINDLEYMEEERRVKKAFLKECFQLAIGLVIIALAAVGIVSLTTHFMGW